VIVNEYEEWSWESIYEIRNVNYYIFTEYDQSEDSDDNVEETNNVIEKVNEAQPEMRPHRVKQVSIRLEDCEMLHDSVVNDDE